MHLTTACAALNSSLNFGPESCSKICTKIWSRLPWPKRGSVSHISSANALKVAVKLALKLVLKLTRTTIFSEGHTESVSALEVLVSGIY